MPDQPTAFPPQHQDEKPGRESEMTPAPKYDAPLYRGSRKLENKAAIITGGDSGIGRSVAILFAREGADVAIVYLNEHEDARETQRLVEIEGRQCELIPGDLRDEAFCVAAVEKTHATFGRLDVVVNNAAWQEAHESFADLPTEGLERTFRTNILAMFHVTKAALPFLKEGAAIVNTSSVVATKGHALLVDYATTKGAIVSFTKSLAANLAKKGIRVNAVSPGPIWTPFIPSTFGPAETAVFGQSTPMGRAGQPEEVAPAYVFLASNDASYITGTEIHVDGGALVGG